MAKECLKWSDMPPPTGRFLPKPFYDQESDTLTLFIHDDESYRERVDRYLTVYRSIASEKVVGCHVKDVRKVLKTAKAFGIHIKTKDLTLAVLLMSVPWAAINDPAPEEIRFHQYREVVTPILEDAGNIALLMPELVS